MIGKKEVEHIANLANLKLDDRDIEHFTSQLRDILSYIEILNELDTDDIIPTAYTVPMKNVLREDKVKPSMDRDTVLSNTAEKKDGQFKVPRIMGE